MAPPLSFGSYLLLDRLGVGARSEVLRARLRSGGPLVALKRVLAGAAHDGLTLRLLMAEADLVRELSHPGIVSLVDQGVVSGVPFVVYELVSGKDLESLMTAARERNYRLPEEAWLGILLQLTEALVYLHGFAKGGAPAPILHRDVSPSNVLVGVDGKVKLVDFGIAKVEGRNTTTGVGEIKGTVRYMSPEQMAGDELDGRSDLYALGVIFLELLTGRPLFDGQRPVAILQQVSKGESREIETALAGLEPRVSQLLRKVLAHRRTERYDTAAQFLEALRGLVEPAGTRVSDLAIARVVGDLFPEVAAKSATSVEESLEMAEDKGGSDLDVFEGLAKKSARPSSLPSGGPASVPATSSGPMSAPPKSIGAPPPPLPPPAGSSAAPPPAGSSAAPPPAGSSAAPPPPSLKPSKTKTTLMGVPAPLPPPSLAPSSTGTPLPPLPSKSIPLPPPASKTSEPPSSEAPKSLSKPPKPPQTLMAAVAPPPPAAPSIGSTLGLPSGKSGVPPAADSVDEKTPPKGTAADGGDARAASVDMDWEEDEESTHVFEKQHLGMGKSGPRPAAGAPVSMAPSKVGAAAALLAGSGGTAAPLSLPPAPAVPRVSEPPMTSPSPRLPPPSVVPPMSGQQHAQQQAPGQVAMAQAPRRPSDEATVVRGKEGSSGKLGAILGGLALIAVVALGVYMLLPRTGDLKIEVKAKSGNPIAKAEIFVDGQKRCDTTPCVVDGLDTGRKSVKVIVGDAIAEETATVEAGKEKTVFVTIALGETPESTSSSQPVANEGTGIKLSGPAGVKVFVDGSDRGSLPAKLSDLSAGEHKLKLDGGERYETVEKTIKVESGKLEDLGEHKPKVIRGKVTLELKTDGALVMLSSTVDGKKVEKRLADAVWKSPPVSLNIDTKEQWTLVASKKGFEDFTQEVSFQDGEAERTLVIELVEKGAPPGPTPGPGPGPTPGPGPGPGPGPKDPPPVATGKGTLNINSIPVSKVVLDGRPLGSTPQAGISVAAGKHTVTFVHPEKGRKTVVVNVAAGKTAVASVKFD